jgi:hypothetical protein
MGINTVWQFVYMADAIERDNFGRILKRKSGFFEPAKKDAVFSAR